MTTGNSSLYNSAIMTDKARWKQLALLGVLKSSERPVTSSQIREELVAQGYDISERTVRYYLLQMDREGLTENLGKKGRQITARGLREVESSRIIERVGFLSAKIDRMTYGMDFDLASRRGTVVANVTLVEPQVLLGHADMICKVYEHGYAMGHLLGLMQPGERIGPNIVPEGMIGIGTVCSVTLNGVLLKHGIPTDSRFGGLLDLQKRQPTRFVEIITYAGTSIDPLEVFIRSGMTNYVGAVSTGDGRIGASFREFPAESRDRVERLALRLENVGLGGFMRIGRSGQPVLDIPVSEGRIGAVVIGGLNPMAIFEETGLRVHSVTMAGLMDYGRLFHYSELPDRVSPLVQPWDRCTNRPYDSSANSTSSS